MFKRLLRNLFLVAFIAGGFALPAFGASSGTCYDTADTVLMLHMDGSDGSTTFTDSGPGARSITVQGNAQIDTAQSKFGGASGLFDGTGDGLVTAAAIPSLTGNFTFDFWMRFNTHADEKTLYKNVTASDIQWNYHNVSGGRWDLAVAGTTGSLTVASDTGVWHHFAAVRSGTTTTFYKDGTSQGTITDGDATASEVLYIAIHNTGIFSVDGWFDELRVTQNAVWTANFTAPSSAYVDCSAERNTSMSLTGAGK